jgi:hypothetical protein
VVGNPVEAGLCQEQWAWAWSSCRAYALGQSDLLLAANPWYDGLAAYSPRRQALWRQFLLGEDRKEAAIREQAWAVGDEEFRRAFQQVKARPVPRSRGGPRKQAARCAPDHGTLFPES